MNPRSADIIRTAKQVVTGTADGPEIVDVWSRTKPKYRRRAVILLLINAALFVGLGCFAFWLRTGIAYGPFSVHDYGQRLWTAFDPVAEDPVTLADFLLFPINLEDVPLQIVVVGLLLATLTSIPILVAILYRFPLAAVFIAIVAFVAMMPWLAITLTISCLIASARPFKLGFRYAYALIALIPVVVYFLVNIMRFGASVPVVTPEERVKVYAPLVLAALASCVLMAIVLLIARLVNYRPGAIAPLLAVMFAVPWGLFHAKIGRDELYYRLLEHDCGPESRTFFVDRDENETIRRYAQMLYEQDPHPQRDIRALMEIVKTQLEFELQREPLASHHHQEALRQDTAFATDQAIVVSRCDEFRRTFPDSKYMPNVLYLQGRGLDMRVDLDTFKKSGVIKHYEDMPAAVSREVWQTLVTQFPESPPACVALYRVAQLDLREGKVDAALRGLRRLIDDFASVATGSRPARPPGLRGLFAARPPTASLGIDLARTVLDARKLAYLIRNNRDPALGDRPLMELFQLDPRSSHYLENVRQLADRYARSKLADNLLVRRVLAERFGFTRVEELRGLVERGRVRAGSDADLERRFHLALEYVREGDRDDARDLFTAVIEADPESPWADDARRRRQTLGL